MKQISADHEILSLTSNNEEMVDTLYCTDHTKKKLDCYCNQCSKPVCTDCIIQSHNGHSVDSLIQVYKKTIKYYENLKAEIENSLLPKYREKLDKEKATSLAFSKRADEIKKEMERHADDMVDNIRKFCTQSVAHLKNEEHSGLQKMKEYTDCLEAKITDLQQMSRKISENIEAKPETSFFQSNNSYDLNRFKTPQVSVGYTLSDFRPGRSITQKDFGKPPDLQSKLGYSHQIKIHVS